MTLAFLDPYRDHRSPIHDLDARLKLVMTVAVILIVNATPITSWPAHAVDLIVLVAVVGVARLSVAHVVGRSMIVLPFVLMAAIGLPFVQEGAAIASVRLPWGVIRVTDVGMLRFATVMVRGWLSLLAAIVLVSSTPFVEIARAMRLLGLPDILTSVIMLMYRYIFVLVDQAQRLMRARDARSTALLGKRAGRSLVWRAQVSGRMIGTLFLRTYERSERIYQAMLARGYDGGFRTLRATRPISRRQVALGGAALVAMAAVAVLTSL